MKKLLLTTVLVIASIAAFCQATGLPLGDYPTGGSLGPASTTIDVISLINVSQTTAGQTIIMPTPSNLSAGKNVTINNTGTVPFTIVPGGIVNPGTGVIYRWTGAWSVTGAGMSTTVESANRAYAGPSSGAAAVPAFRPLVEDDIPTLSASTKISGLGTVATSNNYNDLSNKPTIPTNTNQLTNGAGYITGINSSMVTTALGFNPYNSTNPNGYISNISSFTTANLTENTNLYFTNTRSRSAVSLTTTGTSGSATYNSSTGVFNIPTYTAPVNADWNSSSGLSQILNKPTIKLRETFSGVTSGSGTYTVTFSNTYSVAPNVQANIINGTNTNLIKIGTPTTTSVTVTVVNRVDVVGLLPTYNAANGISVDILVTEK